MIKVIGLDLGKTWGWSLIQDRIPGTGMGPMVEFGEETIGDDPLRNASSGMVYHTFQRWLRKFLDRNWPKCLCFESVRFTRGFSYVDGQKGILLAELEAREIEYYGVPIAQLKKWATGSGRASKDDVVAAIRNQWTAKLPAGFGQESWDGRWKLTDNMADAMWAGHHAYVTLWKARMEEQK